MARVPCLKRYGDGDALAGGGAFAVSIVSDSMYTAFVGAPS